jgi:MoxR-vWA-beta-propeller ternary system domain bpX2
MNGAWERVRAARLPPDGLAALAPVRCQPGVTIHTRGQTWVLWPADTTDVVRCLHPVAGVEFFEERDGRWYAFGRRLPSADGPPAGAGEPLDRVLFPTPLPVQPPPAELPSPVSVRLVRGGPARPATALRCRVADLARWSDAATTAELAAVRAARFGELALLLGRRLPHIANGERFWGERVLVPLGFRPEPDLPADVIRVACRVADEELLVLAADGAEAILESVFEPLTRAGLRRAITFGDRGGTRADALGAP